MKDTDLTAPVVKVFTLQMGVLCPSAVQVYRPTPLFLFSPRMHLSF